MASFFATLSARSEFLPPITRTCTLQSALADGFAPIEKRGVRVSHIWMTKERLAELEDDCSSPGVLWGAKIHTWKREEIFLFGDSYEEDPLEPLGTEETQDEDTDFLEEIGDPEESHPKGTPVPLEPPKRQMLMQELRMVTSPPQPLLSIP